MDIIYNLLRIAVILLATVNGQELLNNKCDFSQRHQILTCVDLNLKDSDLGNLIKEDTYVLILKGSGNLEVPSNYHTNKNFQHIVSYQLIYNGVVQIHSLAFKEMEHLRYLRIANNQQWSKVESNTFAGLSKLETLTIVNNSISQLENNALEGLSELDVLELTHNKLKVISSGAFTSLKSVTSLFLYRNEIEILENMCFEGPTQVELIDLSHNNLKELKTLEFNQLTKLRDLYLSFNQIAVIEGKFTLPNLKFLYLRHNKLVSITDLVFNSSPQLMSIDLSHNEITSVSNNTFSELPLLDYIHLAHNRKTSFDNLKFSDKADVHIVI